MGKTLGSIIAVAAAIAVNVIPGVGQALSAAIGTTLATSVISAVTLYGLQSAASLLGIGASSSKPETTETAIKTSRPPRVSAYGRSRLYGAYILYETASNGTAVDVYAVHHDKIDGIEAHYLGDEAVTLTGTAVNEGPDGRYRGGAVNLYTTDGSVPGVGLPAITALVPEWTGRGDAVALLALTAKSVKAKYFQETYPQSTVPVPSLVARWQRCPDPSAADPLDESGWTWTENGPRHLLHYKLVREGPKPALPRSHADYPAQLLALRQDWWARKIAPTLDYWVAAVADADSARALKAGGTEPRYRSAVSHKHTDQHKDPQAAILATFDGWMAPRADGALVIYSGRYYEPDAADRIGPDEIVSYTWDGGDVDDDQAVNEIVCSYISAEHDYNTVETNAWRDEADITKRGQVLSAPLDAMVPSWGQSRFLAKRKMARTNARNRGTITTNIAGRKVRGKRYIPLHLEEAGTVFFSGVAEITALTRNIRGGVTFSWVAADPNVDNWNPVTEEGDPAAKGNRVAPQPVAAPTITDAAAVFDADGVRLALVVDSADRDDLTWYAHWRLVGATVWGPDEEYTDTDPGEAVDLRTGLVPSNANIEVQVAYQTGDGRFSDWSSTVTVSTSTDALAPGPVTMLTAAASTTGAEIGWRNPTTPNFAYLRLYRSTTTSFGDAVQVGGNIPSAGLGAMQSVVDSPRAGDFNYWVRPYSTGNVPAAATGPAAVRVLFGPGNLIPLPNDFTAVWARDAGGGGTPPTVTADYGVAPDGTNTADRVQYTRAGGYSRLSRSVAVTAGATYRYGVWLKSASAGYGPSLRAGDDAPAALTLTTDWRYYERSVVPTGSSLGIEMLIWANLANSPATADVQAWGAQLRPA